MVFAKVFFFYLPDESILQKDKPVIIYWNIIFFFCNKKKGYPKNREQPLNSLICLHFRHPAIIHLNYSANSFFLAPDTKIECISKTHPSSIDSMDYSLPPSD